ncbi:RING finger protein 112-like [Mauremys mutica]|uniref:RING finger protein 112-like n=1 Tax=Mauremys mutica TaxID=74926 RepID=UPI001D1699EF|nr:RING finger protein 112-like [Mauremys mutica]
MEPRRPVQLVRLDEEGGLTLDEEALSRCLEQGGVGDAPVCLVSIIGEQRLGRSFLLNYLLRRLRSLDASDGSWMGREEEPLEGFEWRVGTQRVTKGVWAWSQPFWVPAEGGKVAVLLVDTEGSMDIERNKETSIKLSAMSMLLSSYQILNIGHRVKDPDLEYLEMFLQVAEVVGEAYGLEPVQMLAATSPCKHPKALEVLSRSSSRCYLMPFPGKRISTGSEGSLRDMDEDFRDSLRDYVTALVGLAGQHVRRDRHGELLTGTQLAAKIKNLSDMMKKHRSGFSYPCQMAIAFHNQRVMDSASKDHAVFLKEKDGLSRHMDDCLKVTPNAMAQQLAEQRTSLLGRCREEMKEPEETLLTALEEELTQEAETFLETYGRCYQHHANQRAKHRARQDHADFLKEKDVLSRHMDDCLKVTPNAMAQQLVEQRRSLLGRCREEMKEPEETLLTALEEELTQDAETFLETYRERYQRHTNQRAMDRARQDHTAFLEKSNVFTSSEEFVAQRTKLLERCRIEMLPKTESAPNAELMKDKEALLKKLEAELKQKAERMLKAANEKLKNMALGAGVAAPAGAEVVTAVGVGLITAARAVLAATAGTSI